MTQIIHSPPKKESSVSITDQNSLPTEHFQSLTQTNVSVPTNSSIKNLEKLRVTILSNIWIPVLVLVFYAMVCGFSVTVSFNPVLH